MLHHDQALGPVLHGYFFHELVHLSLSWRVLNHLLHFVTSRRSGVQEALSAFYPGERVYVLLAVPVRAELAPVKSDLVTRSERLQRRLPVLRLIIPWFKVWLSSTLSGRKSEPR